MEGMNLDQRNWDLQTKTKKKPETIFVWITFNKKPMKYGRLTPYHLHGYSLFTVFQNSFHEGIFPELLKVVKDLQLKMLKK